VTLNSFIASDAKNKFCELRNLRNESDVEQFFVIRLLKDLGYKDSLIETKATIREESIGKGKGRKNYKPDYVVYLDEAHNKPVLIIDAKNPSQNADEGLSDSQLYASVIRRKLEPPKPDQYCVGINGLKLIVKHYDSDKVEHMLSFLDFQDGNTKYETLKSKLTYSSLLLQSREEIEVFEFRKPPRDEVVGIFRACHNVIWRSEKKNPVGAFFEFAKLMFVKLRSDKRLREDQWLKQRIWEGKPLPKDEIIFSNYWIEREEKEKPNPINEILFGELRKELRDEYKKGTKKRIFNDDEKIALKPSTIKRAVELLEHYDLYGVDEDLNGKLFETFLSATMRGKALGQFFTPRSVVQFMTHLADLKANKEHIDKVLDACCGTGGFLIEAMAVMGQKIKENASLSDVEKKEYLDQLKEECLFGIDVGDGPPSIARIARINMYLHGDGGSKIFFLDALDKDMTIEKGMDEEVVDEIRELKGTLTTKSLKFDVVLTNPPFAMRYTKKDKDQRKILEQYDLAYDPIGKDKSRNLRQSLRSSIMFIERYYDLLRPHGKLLTIMDESVLNTKSNKDFRDYIMSRFIVRAVISLPQNTFVNTGSGVKTSVLYLVKKEKTEEQQPKVFMAISQNVGHTDSGKNAQELSDLDNIRDSFRKFELGQVR